jgi:diphthamide synthase subunit DPH2
MMTSLKDQHELHMAREFEKLLDWAGSPTYLAAFLKTTPQIVANWKT